MMKKKLVNSLNSETLFTFKSNNHFEMSTSLISITLIAFLSFDVGGSEVPSIPPDYPFSVVSFRNIETYYLEMNKIGLSSAIPMFRLSVEKKYDFCRAIFGSTLFKIREISLIDIFDSKVREEMRKKFPEVYAYYYTETNGYLRNNAKVDLPYENGEIMIKKQLIDEEMIACPIQDADLDRPTVYYISKLYPPSQRVTFALMFFILSFDYMDNAFTVEALAEDVAEPVHNNFDLVVEDYLKKHQNDDCSPSEDGKIADQKNAQGRLCFLPQWMKLRVCSSILNSRKYRGTIEFVPVDFGVDLHCIKGSVPIKITSDNNLNETREQIFEDWMITCRARVIETNEPISFYVSDGFEDETSAFVYTSSSAVKINHELVAYFKRVHALTTM